MKSASTAAAFTGRLVVLVEERVDEQPVAAGDEREARMAEPGDFDGHGRASLGVGEAGVCLDLYPVRYNGGKDVGGADAPRAADLRVAASARVNAATCGT